MAKLLHRFVGLLASLLGGMLATAIFNRIWKLTPGEDEAPKATDADRGLPEVLAAAALQGALFGVVQASLDRAAAAGAQKLTGTWPGEEEHPEPGKAAS